MASESHNTTLDRMRKEFNHFKNDFSIELSGVSNTLNEKFDSLYKLLGKSEGKIKANINEIFMESLTSVKDSILEALKAENLKSKSRVDSLEEKVIKLDVLRH